MCGGTKYRQEKISHKNKTEKKKYNFNAGRSSKNVEFVFYLNIKTDSIYKMRAAKIIRAHVCERMRHATADSLFSFDFCSHLFFTFINCKFKYIQKLK